MHLNCGVGENYLKIPLECKETKSASPKRNQWWLFIGRTEAEAEAHILQPPNMKRGLMEMLGGLKSKGEKEGREWHD